MTNNPTIDGVSRELLQRWLDNADFFNHLDGMSMPSIDEARKEDERILEELRALLDSPVVERQPDASINWKVVAAEQMSIIEQRQSTIAQLHAQAADLTLEIEQGESIELLREISEYLDGSKLNSVCSDSILHRKIKACLDATAALNGGKP